MSCRILIHASPDPISEITTDHPLLGNLCFLDFSPNEDCVDDINDDEALASAYALEIDDSLICRRCSTECDIFGRQGGYGSIIEEMGVTP